MVQQFYKTAGSVTFAVRATVHWLNQFLLNRNLGTTGKGQYIVGRLVLGVMRGRQITFAQCGPTHIFHLSNSDTHQIHDAQISGHGLGISQSASLFLSQADLHAGEILVLCSDLPAGWDAALLAEHPAGAEVLQRKLLGLNANDVNAVMVQVQVGKGNLNLQRGIQPTAKIVQPAAAPVIAAAGPSTLPTVERPSAQVESDRPASRFTRLLSGEESPPPENTLASPTRLASSEVGTVNGTSGGVSRHVRTQPPPARPAESPLGRMGRFVSPRTTTDIPEIKRPPSRRRQGLFKGLAKFIRGARSASQKTAEGMGKFVPNLLPKVEGEAEEPGSGLWLLAIVVPVVIVAIAATVYVQYGRTTQFHQNFDQAVEMANEARVQSNPTEIRRAWESTIYYLDAAEKNLKNQPQAVSLRQEAQTALDNLDGILRLDFHPAIAGGLSRTIQISQMAATDTDLYILDSAHGSILRATLTNQIYEVDTSFKCQPGNYSSTVVDSLVGLVTLPMSNIYNARVMGMDAKGTLLYCGLSDPVAVALVPPQLGFRKITAFTLDTDRKNLYVLDPGSNAIWEYTGNFGQFSDLPIMFFGQQVPQNMASAINLAVNNADLYLLFQDGHVTACPLSRLDVVPVRCTDPAIFKDSRPERQSGTKINDAIFTQMTFASAPDPSLYMLEPLTRAVYRFSPRSDSLELRGQFRATMEQEQYNNGPATAMTIGPNRFIFFSVGDQVLFATDVP